MKYIFIVICLVCQILILSSHRIAGEENVSVQQGENTSKLPTVLIVTLFRNKAHTLPNFFTLLNRLDYPKNRIALWLANQLLLLIETFFMRLLIIIRCENCSGCERIIMRIRHCRYCISGCMFGPKSTTTSILNMIIQRCDVNPKRVLPIGPLSDIKI